MRILHINKFLHVAGGVERYMFEVADQCARAGHEIQYFSMADPRNRECAQSGHFVSPIEYNGTSLAYKLRKAPATVGKTVYSFESRRKLRGLLQESRPDVAHLHLFSHQISPSILHELAAFDVPTVCTLHEYKLVCPSYHLYIHHKHEICERCIGGAYWNAAAQRCLKGSFAASSIAAVAQYVHKWMGIHEKYIDTFIAPSEFLAEKMRQGGLPVDRLRVIRNYVDTGQYTPRFEPGPYVLYFGRLSPEKGLQTLLRAAAETPEIEFHVVGDGPSAGELQALVTELQLTNVSFLGRLDGDALKEEIAGAGCVVLPSEWYENGPMTVIEAFALGKPVVGADIGGIPEMVTAERGILHPPGDPPALATALRELMSDPARAESMGRHGRAYAESLQAAHIGALMAAYTDAAQQHGKALA